MREAIVFSILVGIVAAIVVFVDYRDTPEEKAEKLRLKELGVELDYKRVRRELGPIQPATIPYELPDEPDLAMLALDEIEHETFFETVEECRNDFPTAS